MVAVAALLLLFTAPSQQVALDESFDGGVFPPPAWSETFLGVGPGWEESSGSALHDAFLGAQDSRLLTPVMDLQSFGSVWLHAVEGSLDSPFRDRNAMQVSLDGGLTFSDVYVSAIADGGGQMLELDLSAWAGLPTVQLAFHYQGDFSNQWWLESVRVDDQPYAPPPRWPHLPQRITMADGFFQDFEGLDGLFPMYLRVNALDAASRLDSADAWCNYGQLGPCTTAFGECALEMGRRPGSGPGPIMSNALIVGLNGGGGGRLLCQFNALNFGEEVDPDDGVFLSQDGTTWFALGNDWETATGGPGNLGTWQSVRVPLDSADVDTSIDFYFAIAQADNRPFADLDGVVVDDLRFFYQPELDVWSGLNNKVNLEVLRAQPAARVTFYFSKVGPGPTFTPWGALDLSRPIEILAVSFADAAGQVRITGEAPPWTSGLTAWSQAVELFNGVVVISTPNTFVLP